MLLRKLLFISIVIVLGGFALESQAQTSSVFTVGLMNPTKIIYAQRQGYLIVSEAGMPAIPNSGRISIISKTGARFTLIGGLPSGPSAPNGDASGPSAMVIQGNTLYIAIGVGNSTMNGPAPGSMVPNPNPNSPLFSSILEIKLPSREFSANEFQFRMSPATQSRLVDGETIELSTKAAQRLRLRVVVNFPDFVPSPRPDVPNNVIPSNPFGLAVTGDRLYVADAAQNSIRTVDLDDSTTGTLITYPSLQNPLPGPPFIDPVPTSLRLYNDKLLVTFLTGFPFPAGLASVRQYDLESGTESKLIGGLSSAIDVLPLNEGGFCSTAYTLEFSTNMLAGAPGRLQRFDTPTGTPTVLSSTLVSPTSIARDPTSGDLFVTEIFPGRIIRFLN